MIPSVYDFHWSLGHLIFIGAFFTVVSAMAAFFAIALWRAQRDLVAQRTEALRWREDFQALPTACRRCRYELAREVEERTCPNGFDCRECSFRAEMLEKKSGDTSDQPATEQDQLGFQMPPDRFYHRGHTWVVREEGGTVLVGLDDLGRRLIGEPERVELPSIGAAIQVNGPAWMIRKNGLEVRVLSPVQGTVVETGGPDQDFYLRIELSENENALGHLLQGNEIRPWLLAEMERLQGLLSEEAGPVHLADGGEPAQDFTQGYPQANWDVVWGEMFLEN